MRYLPHVDGLRALAVLPVILFHLNPEYLPQGFLGVDVFFVISGYLITSIIYPEMQAASFSFGRFWARRVRRILPVLGALIIVSLVVFAFLGFPGSLVERAQTAIAAAGMVSNIYILLHFGNYWGSEAESSPFLHTWSLAVEEQFYLFFPLLLYLAHRRWPNHVARLIAAATILSFILFGYFGHAKPNAAFYLFITRAWELGVGCFLAVATLPRPNRAISEALVATGTAAVVVPYLLPGHSAVSLGSALSVVLGAGAIIRWGGGTRIARAILENKGMVSIGKLSYSLYIWHWPVIVFAKEFGVASGRDFPPVSLIAIIMVLSLASYFLIETPIRKARAPLIFPLSFPISGAVLAAILWVTWSPVTSAPGGYLQPRYAGPYYDISPVQPEDDAQTVAKRDGISIRVKADNEPPIYPSGGRIMNYGDKAKIMILGDSHSLMWAPIIDEISKKDGYTAIISGMTATSPFLDFVNPAQLQGSDRGSREQRQEIAAARRKVVDTLHPDLVIVAVRHLPDAVLLQKFVDYFKERSIPLLFMVQPPVLRIGNNGAHQFARYVLRFRKHIPGAPVLVETTDEHELSRQRLAQIVEQCASCFMFDTPTYLLGGPRLSKIADGNVIVYYDDDHLSLDGAALLEVPLEQAITRIIGPR